MQHEICMANRMACDLERTKPKTYAATQAAKANEKWNTKRNQ
jgi:hypothetical protein